MYEGNQKEITRQLYPEAVSSIDRFDTERRQLYDWLAVKTVEMPDLRTIHTESIIRQHEVTDRLSHSAVILRNSVPQSEIVSSLITESWLTDDHDRVGLFNALLPELQFDFEDPSAISSGVQEAVFASSDDIELAENINDNYFESLHADVRLLLLGMSAKRSMSSTKNAMSPFECSCPPSYILEAGASYLNALSFRFGNWALSQTLKE